MKKLFFALFICFSFFAISTSVFAADNGESHLEKSQKASQEKLDKKLQKLGYPEELIAIMEIEQKQDIISSNGKFAGYEKSDFYRDANGTLKEAEPVGDISIMSTIPKTELTLYNTRSDLGIINGRRTYRIFVNWEWKMGTWYAWEDKIGLSYSDNFETRVSNNGNYACKSYARSTQSSYSTTTDCGGRPSEVSFGGAAWNFDQQYGEQIRNSGWAQMDIQTKDNTSPTGTGITLSKYYHKTGFDGGLGVSIGYLSISINSGSGYDEAAAQSSWSY